jgi:hypothetical protein
MIPLVPIVVVVAMALGAALTVVNNRLVAIGRADNTKVLIFKLQKIFRFRRFEICVLIFRKMRIKS